MMWVIAGLAICAATCFRVPAKAFQYGIIPTVVMTVGILVFAYYLMVFKHLP